MVILTYFKKYGSAIIGARARFSPGNGCPCGGGAIAGKIISREGIEVLAYTKRWGGCHNPAQSRVRIIATSRLMCPDLDATETWRQN